MLNAQEAAQRLGLNRWTILNMVKRGDLTAYKIRGSKAFRFKEADIDAVIEKVETPQKEKAA